MADWLERTELLIGGEAVNKLKKAHVLIVGLGGVGSFAAEFIARSGVGKLTIIDGDTFDITNKNRQLTALESTIGRGKAVVLAERLVDINPDIKLNVLEEFVEPSRVWEIMKTYEPDIVMDCIDSVTPKLEWILACMRFKVRIISHMGAGGKMDVSRVQVARLTNTYNCKLAAHIKKRLRKKGVDFRRVRTVFSSELQNKDALKMTDGTGFKRSFYGTSAFMPAMFGLVGATECIRLITREVEEKE